MGLGMIVAFLGYAILYWGIQSLQGNTQDPFVKSILPF
jgi:hypothetical protein